MGGGGAQRLSGARPAVGGEQKARIGQSAEDTAEQSASSVAGFRSAAYGKRRERKTHVGETVE